jgi:hypothetical protein
MQRYLCDVIKTFHFLVFKKKNEKEKKWKKNEKIKKNKKNNNKLFEKVRAKD